MTARRPAPRDRLSWDRAYRMPTNPAEVLPERRPRELANQRGATGPVLLVDQLNSDLRRRFDAQLAAFRAAEELVRITTLAAKYGMHVDHDAYVTWDLARYDWERARTITERNRG